MAAYFSAGKIALGEWDTFTWNNEIQTSVSEYVVCLAGCLRWLLFGIIVYFSLWAVAVRTIGEVLPSLISVCLCVFPCCSCTFFLFLVNSSTGSGTYCTLFRMPGVVCITQKRWIKCHPPLPSPILTPLDFHFLCPLLMAPITKRSEELDRFSLVPMKSQGSSTKPTENQQTDLKPISYLKLWTWRDAKHSPDSDVSSCTNLL